MKNEILVLNKSWTPIRIVSMKTGISLLFKTNKDLTPKAHIINPKTYHTMTLSEWLNFQPSGDDESIITPKYKLLRPKVIIINHFTGVAKSKIIFSRKSLFQRDNYTCQYCGIEFSESKLSIEHIIPVSKGGSTNWINCVAACFKCNKKKGDKLLEDTKLNLIRKPYEPSWQQIFNVRLKDINLPN